MPRKQTISVKMPPVSIDTWMPATIRPGLFPSEKAVSFVDANGQEIAVFVSSSQVDESRNAVLVLVLDRDQNYVLVQVPARGGSTVAKVAKEGIRPS